MAYDDAGHEERGGCRGKVGGEMIEGGGSTCRVWGEGGFDES